MIDEQAAHEAFEELVGGPERGFRLLRLWQASANPVGTDLFLKPNRCNIFRRHAKQDGYTDTEINIFLELP